MQQKLKLGKLYKANRSLGFLTGDFVEERLESPKLLTLELGEICIPVRQQIIIGGKRKKILAVTVLFPSGKLGHRFNYDQQTVSIIEKILAGSPGGGSDEVCFVYFCEENNPPFEPCEEKGEDL